MSLVEPRIALAHDYLLFLRGAERTFSGIASCWPQAAIHTIAYSQSETEARFAGREIHTSFLQKIRVRRSTHRYFLGLYPRAAESIKVEPCDILVSSSFGFAHGMHPPPGVKHVSYCHTPFRHCWHERDRAVHTVSPLLRPALSRTLDRIRQWDLAASSRVTTYLANSELTAQRIGDWYERDSKVVHPPVELDRFSIGAPEDFFLFVGELVAHKRADIALEAARLAGRRIVVVGGGPELPALRAKYGSTATFLGRIDDRELASVYRRALALVLPNIEEFGIVAVEAQASGRPVLALGRGGALETVVDGETGVLVGHEAVRDFAEAMREVDFTRFEPQRAQENATRFSSDAFAQSLREAVDAELRPSS